MKFKWNISVMILFILIASSLMWLLAMYFVRQLVWYSGLIHNYYKSYYISKAGLELGLVETNINPVWLNSVVLLSGDINDNFECDTEAKDCWFKMNVIWQTTGLLSDNFWLGAGCTDETAFVLWTGEQMLIPMYITDSWKSHKDNLSKLHFNTDILTNILTKNRLYFAFSWDIDPVDTTINLWIIPVNSDTWKIDNYWRFFMTWSLDQNSIKTFFDKYKTLKESVTNTLLENHYIHYLLIWNDNDKVIKFCINVKNENNSDRKLAMQKYYIESVWFYRDDVVGNFAIKVPASFGF